MKNSGRIGRKQTAFPRDSLRLEPEARLVPWFDATGIALSPSTEKDRMGLPVLDDCCEEHIM